MIGKPQEKVENVIAERCGGSVRLHTSEAGAEPMSTETPSSGVDAGEAQPFDVEERGQRRKIRFAALQPVLVAAEGGTLSVPDAKAVVVGAVAAGLRLNEAQISAHADGVIESFQQLDYLEAAGDGNLAIGETGKKVIARLRKEDAEVEKRAGKS